MVFIVILLIIFVVCGVLGFVIKGLLWLGLIAIVLFLATAVIGGMRNRKSVN